MMDLASAHTNAKALILSLRDGVERLEKAEAVRIETERRERRSGTVYRMLTEFYVELRRRPFLLEQQERREGAPWLSLSPSRCRPRENSAFFFLASKQRDALSSLLISRTGIHK